MVDTYTDEELLISLYGKGKEKTQAQIANGMINRLYERVEELESAGRSVVNAENDASLKDAVSNLAIVLGWKL